MKALVLMALIGILVASPVLAGDLVTPEIRVSSTFTCRVLNFSDKDFKTEVVAVDSGVMPPMTVFDSGVVTVSPNQDFEIGIDTGLPGFPAGVTYFCRFLKASKRKARAEITVSALAGAPDTLVVPAE